MVSDERDQHYLGLEFRFLAHTLCTYTKGTFTVV
jgi:hypothetical protein